MTEDLNCWKDDGTKTQWGFQPTIQLELDKEEDKLCLPNLI